MVLFMPPETCKKLGLAPALGEHTPASQHTPTHHLPIPGHNMEAEETTCPTDPESKVSKCLGLTCFHNISFGGVSFVVVCLFVFSEKTTINLLLSLI